LEKSRKWIIREGLTGISRSGSGAPIACGWKKSLGFLTLLLASFGFALSGRNLVNVPWRGAGDLRALPYLEWMEMDGAGRDTTQDWLLPTHSRPPLVGELERRIEEALATARSSEAAVMTVGAAALDAAEQARRAAELAERASAAVFSSRRQEAPAAEREDEGLRDFHARADFVAARLREIQRVPLAAPDDVESLR
jgi:hypothetical protein